MTKIAVCLLAYNEEDVINSVIQKGYNYLESLDIDFELWIFDNNSTDNTKKIVEELINKKKFLKYYKQDQNVGYGLNTISALKIPHADVIFVLDGDGQYSFEDIPKFLKLINNNFDVMFGIRKKRKDKFLRKITTLVYNFLAKKIINSNLSDINCGFRALNNNAAKKIISRFEYNYIGAEIFMESKKHNFKIGEEEVKHNHREGGDSVFDNISLIIKHAVIMIRHLLELKKIYLKK